MNDTQNKLHQHKVVIIHGLWHSRACLAYLAYSLQELGITNVQTFGYNSIFEAPEVAASKLANVLIADNQVSLIGHSLGGLIALKTALYNPNLPIKNIVCLGTPILGSEAARQLDKKDTSKWILGKSRELLLQGCTQLPNEIAVGMIAGNKHFLSLGTFLTNLTEENDGVVILKETYIQGLTDYLIMNTSHNGLLFNKDVALQITNFLQHKNFNK